jgi:hypothetical protein
MHPGTVEVRYPPPGKVGVLREARQSLIESRVIKLDTVEDNPYLSTT